MDYGLLLEDFRVSTLQADGSAVLASVWDVGVGWLAGTL